MAWERGEVDVGLRSIAMAGHFAHTEKPEKRARGVLLLQLRERGFEPVKYFTHG